MMKHQQLFDLTDQMLNLARELIGEMRPPLGPPGRPQCAIFLTMAEQFEAILILCRANLATHAAIHARAMLEALVNYRLLGLAPEHVEQMRYEVVQGEKRLYERALKISALPDETRETLQKKLALCLTKYDPLHKKGLRRKQITEQLEHAGLEELAAQYALLCSFSHNDLAALAFRHQGTNGMTLRTPDSFDVLFLVVGLAHYSLVTAAKSLGEIALFSASRFDERKITMEGIYAAAMALGTIDT